MYYVRVRTYGAPDMGPADRPAGEGSLLLWAQEKAGLCGLSGEPGKVTSESWDVGAWDPTDSRWALVPGAGHSQAEARPACARSGQSSTH